MKNNFECIVIGLGSMGSATSYYLSKAGISVLGLEQFSIPNSRGSHSGETRLIRKAYFEHPDYVPLLTMAYQNWAEIESEFKQKLYFETGLSYHGNEKDSLISGIRESSNAYNIPIEKDTKSKTFFNLGHRDTSISEPEAGFLHVDDSINAIVGLAKENGATIKSNETVIKWERKNGKIEVYTDKQNYSCEKLIITAGSYLSKVVPSLSEAYKTTRQLLAWFKPKILSDYTPDKFPCWIVSRKEGGIYYGFPYFEGSKFEGIKAGIHFPGNQIDPSNKKETLENISAELEVLKKEIALILPNFEQEILSWETCRYSMTKDEHFIIDFLPNHDNDVIIAGGFSGHGFKFAPVIGEILSDLAIKGKSQFDLAMFRLDRF